MKIFTNRILLVLVFLISGCTQITSSVLNQSDMSEKDKVLSVHNNYVKYWLENNEDGLIELLEEESRIQPNKLKYIEGKENIRNFWFPKDGSITTINDYQTKVLSLVVMEGFAVTTHSSILDWTYKKDDKEFGRIQEGINTTLYREQVDGSWKIWRSMWTDTKLAKK